MTEIRQLFEYFMITVWIFLHITLICCKTCPYFYIDMPDFSCPLHRVHDKFVHTATHNLQMRWMKC